MSHTTVFLIIDAGRADYVSPQTMPFVHGLASDSLVGSFESPPGFAQRTVLFSGRNPDTSGKFSAFAYDPDQSPFAWLRNLGPAGNMIKARKIMVPARWGIQRISRMISGAYHTDPAWIPPRYLPFFRPCEDMRPLHEPNALGATSVFDLCRQNGLKYRYIAHPESGDDDAVHRTLVRELRQSSDVDLYVAQFSVTDQQGHKHGPFSDAMQRGFLRQLDAKLAGVHAALAAGYDSWDLFLCGDHGMAPVREEVDVLAALKDVPATPAKDYVVFVNSTLVVFWYLTERGRRAIEAVLPDIPGTHVLDEDDRRRLRIPTDDSWGDRMLAADPGIMFWPDYFHVTDSKIVGMHGYLDKVEEGMGMCVVASENGRLPKGDVGLRPLVDVFPTLCDLLDVPTPSQEGVSLIASE